MQRYRLIRPVKPVSVLKPSCFKCGHEFEPEESSFHIHGRINWDSYFDSPGGEVENRLHGLIFCNNCIYNFVGDLE